MTGTEVVGIEADGVRPALAFSLGATTAGAVLAEVSRAAAERDPPPAARYRSAWSCCSSPRAEGMRDATRVRDDGTVSDAEATALRSADERLVQVRDDSPQWREVGPPASPDEQRALAAMRRLLPETPTTHAWANLLFIDVQGRTHEIDVVLLTRAGLFLVELKGWHGTIGGDQQAFHVTSPNRVRRREPNPYLATDLKAKRLARLMSEARGSKAVQIPRIEAITVMHGENSSVTLQGPAAAHTYALDGFGVRGLPPFSDFVKEPPSSERNAVDKQRAGQLVRLLHEAGFRPAPRVRMVGQYQLDDADPLAEGAGWVDIRGRHPTLPGVVRRIRLYDYPPKAPEYDRDRIRHAALREYHLTNGLGHPGVIAARDVADDPDRGPALIFDDDDASTPLDRWLAEQRHQLTVDDRTGIVQKIAEVLRYAHGRGMQHRSLTPAQVHVIERRGEPRRVTVRDWQTGRVDDGTSVSGRATYLRSDTSVLALADQARLVCLAPEALTADNPAGTPVDVYGLGALAYLVLTDQPPAANLAELQAKLTAVGGLDPAAERDDRDDALAAVVRHATAPRVDERTPDVDAVLAELTTAVRDLRPRASEQVAADGAQGVHRLPPLAQRIATDFGGDPRFDNPRAVQLRLAGFGRESLVELGRRVRDLYAEGASERVSEVVDDAYLGELADTVAGRLGGRVGVAPRLYLKKLVGDVLDRVDQFADFDPRRDYALTVRGDELDEVEREVSSVDDIDLPDATP